MTTPRGAFAMCESWAGWAIRGRSGSGLLGHACIIFRGQSADGLRGYGAGRKR